MSSPNDRFGAGSIFSTSGGALVYYSLRHLDAIGVGCLSSLPYSIRVLLEATLRQCDGVFVSKDDVASLACWPEGVSERRELSFVPARVLLQDFTGVPAIVDLAALRSAMLRLGGDPGRINPLVPADLVIDHSVQIDAYGTCYALDKNAEKEFSRNRERYEFLRWGQQAFDGLTVVPPATGICHQVNLEYLANVVQTRRTEGEMVAFPDSLVGTDSHTTMINGLGVLGWGVGGIEAEAVMLGQPYSMLVPDVVGFRMEGRLPDGATATDLVLTVTQMLRNQGVVGKFVEFYGPGLDYLSLADRATVANMSPEYGATMGFFPVDDVTLDYLRATGRDETQVDLVERYTKEQGLFRSRGEPEPAYTVTLMLDLTTVEASLAGPKRPQDRISLSEAKDAFRQALTAPTSERGFALDERSLGERAVLDYAGCQVPMGHGAVVIAAITSCTNTSNPSVLIAAGLLAKKAVERGLAVKPWVKSSLAPGSRVVEDYLRQSGLLAYLEALRFHIVGFGCTTCIGNSGPLPQSVASAIRGHNLVAAAVLSGNRNFEGRINPLTQANYLASPPLVVAYALAGRMDLDLTSEPLGIDPNGKPVFLADIWPSPEEVQAAVQENVNAEQFRSRYETVTSGNETWNDIPVPDGDLYVWDAGSTYIQEPPFFQDMGLEASALTSVRGARVLALLGDSVTTDHISPAGAIAEDGPAGRHLLDHGVGASEFNSFGSRRGNHEVMMRGTFGNIRIKNLLLPGTEGGVTRHFPSGDILSIFDAAQRYQEEDTPLLVIAGKEYGTGSSRDWAAKGTLLLGVCTVIAESYERIHRSNLIGMGVLPLQFAEGDSAEALGLTGEERFSVEGISGLEPGGWVRVRAESESGGVRAFRALARIDSSIELEYYRNGGILHMVLRKMAEEG